VHSNGSSIGSAANRWPASLKWFSVVLDGVTHGLFDGHHLDPDEDYEGKWVMPEPRDIMFHPPWDSGEYST
jgi:hypothetical protein